MGSFKPPTARSIKSIYFGTHCARPLDVHTESNPLWIWRIILKIHEACQCHLEMFVTSFLIDYWFVDEDYSRWYCIICEVSLRNVACSCCRVNTWWCFWKCFKNITCLLKHWNTSVWKIVGVIGTDDLCILTRDFLPRMHRFLFILIGNLFRGAKSDAKGENLTLCAFVRPINVCL